MTNARRWLRGWAYQFSATWRQWRKSHGKRQSLRTAWKLGACGRYVIDGQHRGKREPILGRYLRNAASALHSPSGPAAQPDTGDPERGS